MSLRIADIIEETWDTKTFLFVDDEDQAVAFDYVAGQYLTFRYDGLQDKPIVRSYTMSSSPCQQDYIRVTVKRVEGGLVSNWMCNELKTGDILKARGPIGRFCFDPKICNPHLYMVGAGSGVTPFLSILREYGPRLGQEGCPETASLLVAYRSQKDLIAWDDLKRLSEMPGVRLLTTLTREDATGEGFLYGRPDPKMLDTFCEQRYSTSTYMTCGPVPMMDMVSHYLKEQNVSSDHIMTESFD